MKPPANVIGKLVEMEDTIGVITQSEWEYLIDDFILTVVFMDALDDEEVFAWNTLRSFLCKK